jgi:protein subunit release factor A
VVEIQAGTGGDRLSIFAEDFSYVHEILWKQRLENFGCGYEWRNFGRI